MSRPLRRCRDGSSPRSNATTVQARRRVQSAVQDMATDEEITPTRVAKSLCSSSEPITVEASSLRYFVSKFNRSLRGSKSKPVPSRKRKKIVTWCSAWKTCVAEHQDRAGSFCFLQTPSSTGAYVAMFGHFFSRLEDLHRQGYMTDLMIAVDCTWNVEKANKEMGYTLVYATIYRCLSGRWRKTGWPLLIVRNVRENFAATSLSSHACSRSLPGGAFQNPANVAWTFFQVCPNSSSSTFQSAFRCRD